MASARLVVANRNGVHVRPATQIVQTALGYPCETRLRRGADVARAKSILELIQLGISEGEEVVIEAEGEQAIDSVEAIRGLFESKFGFPD